MFEANARFYYMALMGIYNYMPDESYLKKRYFYATGKKLDLNNPKTFNEKIQWLKIHDRKPEYIDMVDKYRVKGVVSNLIGEEYIIPTLGVWNHFDEINFDQLPNKFVLKCTHDSGGVIIVHNKESLKKRSAKRKIENSLKKNFYYLGREWPYKNVKPRIIAESFIEDSEKLVPEDYKIFCFNGIPKLIQVDYDRFTGHKRNLYTTDWKYIDASIEYPSDAGYIIDPPLKLDEMLRLASKLSTGIPHVRVDFYYVNNKIYFGEMTFYHGSGLEKFSSKDLEDIMGQWIAIPLKNNGDRNNI